MNTAKILVEFHLDHSYYPSPTPQNILGISQLPTGLSTRISKQNLLIYSGQDTDVSYPLLVPLILNEPYFANFTAMPDAFQQSDKEPGVWLLNSQNADKEGNIQFRDCLYVPLHSQYFQYPLPEEKKLREVEITPSPDPHKTLQIPTDQVQTFLIDLRNASPGLYEVTFGFTDDTSVTYSFVASDQLAHKPPSALWLQQAAPELPAPEIPQFTIKFEARETLWRYIFIGLSKADWEKSTLEFSGGDLPNTPLFSHDPEPFSSPNGLTGLSMTSTQPIPLGLLPAYQVQLKSPGIPSPVTLPFAQPSILKRKKGTLAEEHVQYISEIFVHM